MSRAPFRNCTIKCLYPNRSCPGYSYGPKRTIKSIRNPICPPQIHQDEMEDYLNLDGVLEGFQQYLQNKNYTGRPY